MTKTSPKLRFGVYVAALCGALGLVFVYRFLSLTNPDLVVGAGSATIVTWVPPGLAALITGVLSFRAHSLPAPVPRLAKDAALLTALFVVAGFLVNTSGMTAMMTEFSATLALAVALFLAIVFWVHLIGLALGYALARVLPQRVSDSA